MSKIRVLGVSSGLGVSLYPFRNNSILGNIEGRAVFHTTCSSQWKINFGNIPLLREIKGNYDGLDLIVSSPDCGSGSIFRLSRAKVYGDHKKNESLDLVFRAVDKYKPKFFLFENLEGLFKSFPQDEFAAKVSDYQLNVYISPVSAWGNSQIHRKRLVIVGIRKDISSKKLRKYFKLPHLEHTVKTCGELYGDLYDYSKYTDELSAFGHLTESRDELISIHARRKITYYQIQKEWQGRLKGRKRWDVEGGAFSTAPGVYRNLDNSYPATARRANRQFTEPGWPMSPRVLGRIQGVPDDFKIHMEYDKPGRLKYWINKGRTVITKSPPYEISEWLRKQLNKSKHLWQTT